MSGISGSGQGASVTPVAKAFGRYRLLERLGQGGMAEVFKAKSFGVEGFEKVLVIKRILPELARSQEFVDMFIHEAKLAVRLSHANIVQVFDLGRAPLGEDAKSQDAYFMAMEYVHGLDLATLLARCRRQQVPMPIEIAVFACAEVAKGLDHAHRRRDEQLRPLGIVHRDVSPQNVLVSFEGEVKVTDFGIAKARGALEQNETEDTRTRQLHGKFGYMSPEQARGEPVDARSDLFSLGIVLYECIAGVNPFSAPTTFETLRRVQACEYPPATLLRPEAPPELLAILATAMAKTPKERYADAGRMYEAMLAFLYSQGSRYGSHELSEFVVTIQGGDQAPSGSQIEILDGDAVAPQAERTPVEVPPSRSISSVSRVETGVRAVGIDRAAGLGERREVTALVVEFPRGDSTEACSKTCELVLRYGGRVYKRESDQVVALFGLGEPDGRDTEVATRCALLTMRALGGDRPPSAGLHTARIHVSDEGEPTEDERLSGLFASARELARARDGRCVISGAAMRQVKSLFVFEPLNDGSQITNVSGAIVKDVRGPSETFGRFVGRKEELRRIGELLASATRRSARAITVRGAHGVGKTRLLYEVERRLIKGGYNVGWYIATCPPRGREIPLSGLVCMLQILCGTVDGDTHERVMTVLPRLRALGLHDDEVNAVLTSLGANVPTSSSITAKTALRTAFTRMVASLCEDKPHTFAWDAAHCMDEDSFSILEHALGKLKSSRVVFAFTTREGFSHTLEKIEGHLGLDLADLKGEDVARLIAYRLGTDTVPDELVRFVGDRAGGHPLFIEEVIKGLQDASAVTVGERKVVSMRLVGQELALPKTLRGLVASRVARLSAADRASLQASAVLGEPIVTSVLATMLSQQVAPLEKSIDALIKAELLVRTGPSELRLPSPIVREVVIDALPHEATRELHAAAGTALEQSLGDRAWEQASRIATHFYESGDRERAATYFGKSGERRLEARQLEAAVRDISRAIELCDTNRRTPEELGSWLDDLAIAVRLVRAAPEAGQMCDRVIARLDQASDVPARVRARVNACRIFVAMHKFDVATTYLTDAEKIAAGNDDMMKLVLVSAAEMAGRRGEFAQSLKLLLRMQKLATHEGDKQEEHKILINLAQAHAAVGDRASSLAALESAERLLPDDTAAQCERQKLRGLVYYFTRDFQRAAIESEKAVDMARAVGLTYEVGVNLHNVGDVLIRLDDHARAYGALQQSLALCDEFGFERLASHNRMLLAYLAGLKGDAEAEKLLSAGVRYAEANEFMWDVISGRYFLAQLAIKRGGDRDKAKKEIEALRDMARSAGHMLVAEDCEGALLTLG